MGRAIVGMLAVTLWTAGPAAAQGQAGKVRVEKFVYKKTPQGELAMQVHFPPDWKAEDRRPALVFFFGGGWAEGSMEQFTTQADYLAGRGMVAARADYRVKNRHQVTPDKCVEDAKSAVRWLRQNASKLGIDPDHVAAGGGSAGAHIAAAAAIVPGFEAEGEPLTISSRPNLLVLFNPVMNTTGLGPQMMPPEIAKKVSPNDHLAKDAPPAIFFFGSNDRLMATAEEYVAKAKPLALTAELYVADGVGHGFFNRPPWKERTLFLTDQFLAKYGYTKGEPTLQLAEGVQMKRVGTKERQSMLVPGGL